VGGFSTDPSNRAQTLNEVYAIAASFTHVSELEDIEQCVLLASEGYLNSKFIAQFPRIANQYSFSPFLIEKFKSLIDSLMKREGQSEVASTKQSQEVVHDSIKWYALGLSRAVKRRIACDLKGSICYKPLRAIYRLIRLILKKLVKTRA
jgi:hypothetical protein